MSGSEAASSSSLGVSARRCDDDCGGREVCATGGELRCAFRIEPSRESVGCVAVAIAGIVRFGDALSDVGAYERNEAIVVERSPGRGGGGFAS